MFYVLYEPCKDLSPLERELLGVSGRLGAWPDLGNAVVQARRMAERYPALSFWVQDVSGRRWEAPAFKQPDG